MTASLSPLRSCSCVAPIALLGLIIFCLPANAAALNFCHAAKGELKSLCTASGGDVRLVVVELDRHPAAVEARQARTASGKNLSFKALSGYAISLVERQDGFLASLPLNGVRAALLRHDAPQIDGSVRRVEGRLTYLMNGVVLYVADDDMMRLATLPGVRAMHETGVDRILLDNAIDYSLGTQPGIVDRRAAVYGLNEEVTPAGAPDHPEAPDDVRDDGVEGHNMIIAIIDTGVDWRHPMFGGTGLTSPTPRVAGQPESPDDHKKVIYMYNMTPGDPTDDFGHGTLVASNAAGYAVDANTPANTGYGIGADGTGIGPTPSGVRYHGTAPQARIMAYKTCDASGSACLVAFTTLSIEDAASPFTLDLNGTPTATPKPVADVINLSLGGTSGDPLTSHSIAANNAVLDGLMVVASAGNSGSGTPPDVGQVGHPSVATLAISIAASLDPGSIPAQDVLLAGEIPGEPLPGAGPAPETGATSTANLPDLAAPQGTRLFPVAGGGPIPDGSLSAHFVIDDQVTLPYVPSGNLQNRIALVKFTGAFANGANQAASQLPAAILLITDVESPTAVQVLNGIPTFAIKVADAAVLMDLMVTGDNDAVDPPHGTISEMPLRLNAPPIDPNAFQSYMAGFSSRGPNDHANGAFLTVKPDLTAPGVGIEGAATPEGTPDATVGLANPTGYTIANGTSFSGPITAGAAVLVRQYVRDVLGLDSADPADTALRSNASMVARALLQNSATNLRSGLGVEEPDPSPLASINDMGAGHINLADAVSGTAIMVSPTTLRAVEHAGGDMEVLLPTASFALQPVVGMTGDDRILRRVRKVILREIAGGTGAGSYDLSWADNRNATRTGFSVLLTADPNSTIPLGSITLGAGSDAEFYVVTLADGAQMTATDEELMWYVSATNSSTGKRMRMPFYYRTANCASCGADADGDGVPDLQDNCLNEANANQCDTDGDGIGNQCDADLSNNGVVNFDDLAQMKLALFSTPGDAHWNPDADLTCNDVVNFVDLASMKTQFFGPPGPAGGVD